MYKREPYPSESESTSTDTSDVTSRATTLPDSWSETMPQNQQKLDRVNIQLNKEDQSSTPLTTTPSDSTIISKKPDIQRTNNNQANQVNTQNQRQQQTWVNPYWGPNWKPNVTAAQSGTSNININTNTGNSSLPTLAQQLIPGSISTNNRDKINDLSWKQNTQLNSSNSNNSFNPDGKYISNDSGAPPGAYPVTTHIQRQIVTSSPGLTANPENQFGYKRSSSLSDIDSRIRPEFTGQQTSPQKTNNNIQPWINPYWSKLNQTNSQFTQNDNTIPNRNPQLSNDSKQSSWTKTYSGTIHPEKSTSSTNIWKNPYWKNWKPQTSTTSKQEAQPWENPYWKNWKRQTSRTPKQEAQPWENPYWKNWKPQTPRTPNQEGQPWENPYWKNWKPQTSRTPNQEGQPWKNPYWKNWKPQTPRTPNQEGQPWENPYWKTWKLQTSMTPKQEAQPWENPYWKSQTSTTDKQEEQPWKNPYWKDSKPQTSTTPKREDKSWEILYQKDSKPQDSTTSNHQQDKPQQNLYWKDKNISNQGTNGAALNKSLSFEDNVLLVPSFYERIYPPYTPSSSSVSTAQTRPEIVLSSGTPEQIINDNEDLPYTIDSQGIAHYRAAASSPSGTNKTVSFASAPTTSRYPAIPPYTSSVAPTSETSNATSSLKPANTVSLSQTTSSAPSSFPNNITSSAFQNLNNYPSSSFNYSSSTSSANVLTEADLDSIQHALHLIATNPNAIPVVEIPHQIPSSTISHHNNPSSILESLFSVNPEQQSHQQSPPPPSSSFSQNVQFNSPPYAYNSNSQQSTSFSTPSYPSNLDEISHRFITQEQFVLI